MSTLTVLPAWLTPSVMAVTRGGDRGVVARPFEGGARGARGVAAFARLVNLDAVELVFNAGIAVAGGQAAGAGVRNGDDVGGQPAGGRGRIRNLESGVAQVSRPQATPIHLTCHTVCSRPVVSTPTALSIRSCVFEKGDRPRPDVEVEQIGSGRARQRGAGKIRLVEKIDAVLLGQVRRRDRRLRCPGNFGERRVPLRIRVLAVIFREQAVDVHAPAADQDRRGRSTRRDQKCGRRRRRIGGVAHDVERAGLDAARELRVATRSSPSPAARGPAP